MPLPRMVAASTQRPCRDRRTTPRSPVPIVMRVLSSGHRQCPRSA